MRLFVFIFNVYLVLLSGLPCGDRTECDLPSAQISMASDHREHGHTNEICTPFCSCSCCAASVVCEQMNDHVFVLSQQSTVKFPAETASPTHGFNAIWQPPKIA